MTLDELQQMAEKDLKMDDLELADESLKSASLHQKYLSIYNNFRHLYLMSEGNYNVLKRQKWEYYSGKSDPEVYRDKPFDHKILKQDIPLYLDADEELIASYRKREHYKYCMDTCERILKQIQQRGWDIKNAIEWRKFLDGAV